MKYLFLFFFTLFAIMVHAQKHDNIWHFNQHNSTSFEINFNSAPPIVSITNIGMKLSFTNSTFCDIDGDILFYTNGESIHNGLYQLMENGDSLNIGYWADQAGGYRVLRGAFGLPSPSDTTKSYLIYMFEDHFPEANALHTKVHYALIDMAANGGLGKVIEKNVPIITGGLDLNFAHAGAVRHANGRDWWILVPNLMEPKYYRILLSPIGFSAPEAQEIGLNPPTTDPSYYIGENVFSPDGTKYAHYDFRTGVQFFDFDRCTGLLSNPVKVTYTPGPFDNNGQSGVAFSPSGRFAYLTYAQDAKLQLKQYDMHAADIPTSETLISSCDLIEGQWKCGLGLISLAPNNKIYVAATIDSTSMHVINEPDSLGQACGFEYGGLEFPLPFPRLAMPYTPNYRLYDVPGSACDTLGIDAPVSAVEEEGETEYKATVHPNPATDHQATISLPAPLPQPATWRLHDALGREVARAVLSAGQQEAQVGLSGVPPGLYFWQVGNGEGTLGTGKLIIAK